MRASRPKEPPLVGASDPRESVSGPGEGLVAVLDRPPAEVISGPLVELLADDD